MNYNIAVTEGNGIGPEIIKGAKVVLNKVAERFSHSFNFVDITPEDITKAQEFDGALMGPSDNSDENFIGHIISSLCLTAEISSVKFYPQLDSAFALKRDLKGRKIDILIFNTLDNINDCCANCSDIIMQTANTAFKAAEKRNKKVAGIIPACFDMPFCGVMKTASADYIDVEYTEMTVQNAVNQMISSPHSFDVIASDRLFGSILASESISIVGSPGMLSHGFLRSDGFGLYNTFQESSHDIAGLNKANPIGMILSAAMMLRFSFGLEKEACAVEAAVQKALDIGYRTNDIDYVWFIKGSLKCGTIEMSRAIAENI